MVMTFVESSVAQQLYVLLTPKRVLGMPRKHDHALVCTDRQCESCATTGSVLSKYFGASQPSRLGMQYALVCTAAVVDCCGLLTDQPYTRNSLGTHHCTMSTKVATLNWLNCCLPWEPRSASSIVYVNASSSNVCLQQRWLCAVVDQAGGGGTVVDQLGSANTAGPYTTLQGA
jgi:hypothetical protein